MLRFYVCDIITIDGTFWAAMKEVQQAQGIPQRFMSEDLRVDETAAGGKMLVWCDVTDAEHAVLAADPRIVWVPFEDQSGNALPITATIGDIAPARRTQIRTRLEALHVPIDDLTLTDPIRKVIARVVRRNRVRRALALRYANARVADSQDFSEGMDTLISAVPVAKRSAISQRLQAVGYDPSVIAPTDTIREAVQKLAVQDVAFNRNGWD